MLASVKTGNIDQAHNLRKMVKKSDYSQNSSEVLRNIHEDSYKTQIITITSGKGGVGKSSLTVNLGLALVKAGKRVLLFDADLGLANINVLMGIIPKYNLYHLMKGSKKMSEVIVHSPEGLDIIPGASGYSSLADMSRKEREVILEGLEELNRYDIVLVDTGAGISANVVDFTLPADKILVVTTPEPTSITDAYGIIKSIVLVDPSKSISLIVNRANASLEGRKVAERLVSICSQFLEYNIVNYSFILEDENVSRSVRKQKPFYLLYPRGKASSCLNIVASKLIDEGIAALSPKDSITGFFRKLFQV